MRAVTRLSAIVSLAALAACQSTVEEVRSLAAGAPPLAAAPARAMAGYLPGPAVAPSADRFADTVPGGWKAVTDEPVSTFSADVDTASYAFARRLLREGRLPPVAAVRVEEMVNYFPYDYPAPASADQPFAATVTVAPSPWTDGARLVHVGVRGYDVTRDRRPPARLTFLVDTSGSMASQDRLPLVKQALMRLGDGLRADDRVAIVTYAGDARVALDPTPGDDIARIEAAIQSLGAAGGTHGAAGIRTAYALAQGMFARDAVNRVILATDGDFNLGLTNPRELERMIADKRRTGVYLTVLGVGSGNLNDALMQRLAQAGNGQAAYLDSLLEARKVWVEELGSTMFPIADDVKLQVEFNPATVAAYRLVGYETRALARHDFNDDRVDAGDIGGGHTVTVIYEVLPVGVPGAKLDPLRYAREAPPAAKADELAFLRIRYKLPGGAESRLIERPIRVAEALPRLDAAPTEIRFAVAVAGFAQLLRGESVGRLGFAEVAAAADDARGRDPFGWRAEFVQLARMAATMRR